MVLTIAASRLVENDPALFFDANGGVEELQRELRLADAGTADDRRGRAGNKSAA